MNRIVWYDTGDGTREGTLIKVNGNLALIADAVTGEELWLSPAEWWEDESEDGRDIATYTNGYSF